MTQIIQVEAAPAVPDIAIYVASLADYNEGRLVGAWIDASRGEDLIQEDIDKMLEKADDYACTVALMGAGYGLSSYQGAAMSSWRGPDGKAYIYSSAREMVDDLDIYVSEREEWAIHDHQGFDNIDIGENPDLEDLAVYAAGIIEHGRAFSLFVEYSHDPETFEEAYQGTYDSAEDYARQVVEDCGGLPDNYLANYIDYAALARDMEYGGDIWAVDYDYGKVAIFRNI